MNETDNMKMQNKCYSHHFKILLQVEKTKFILVSPRNTRSSLTCGIQSMGRDFFLMA